MTFSHSGRPINYGLAVHSGLFTVKNVWWVLIGQSGLASLIQSMNPKVFQRLSSNIELKPIIVEDLIKAVDIRVAKFHSEDSGNGSSPITKDVYLKLFESSNGEIRFVFKYCQSICINLVQTVRKDIVIESKKMDESKFSEFMGRYLLNNQVNKDYSYACLKRIIQGEFEGLYLNQDEKSVLKKIGIMQKVSPKEFKEFSDLGVGSMQNFTTNYLVKLRDQQLLFRRQQGKKLTYELRGISVFASEYGFLDE